MSIFSILDGPFVDWFDRSRSLYISDLILNDYGEYRMKHVEVRALNIDTFKCF